MRHDHHLQRLIMASNPKPGSVAFSSAQSMTDFRRLQEIMAATNGRSPALPTADERVALKAIFGRMPNDAKARLRPIAERLGLTD